jgi:hypothetical protein
MAKQLRGFAAITGHGETLDLYHNSPLAVAPKPRTVVIRRSSTTWSFPLAPVPSSRLRASYSHDGSGIASLTDILSLCALTVGAMKQTKTSEIHQVTRVSVQWELDMNSNGSGPHHPPGALLADPE